MLSLDGDLRVLLTTAEAAEAVGVEPGVIRVWAHRGHLKRANGRHGHPRYRLLDVLHAEKATRSKAGRTYSAAA